MFFITHNKSVIFLAEGCIPTACNGFVVCSFYRAWHPDGMLTKDAAPFALFEREIKIGQLNFMEHHRQSLQWAKEQYDLLQKQIKECLFHNGKDM